MDVQAIHELGPVRLDRLDADVENASNFLGAMALGDELQGFALPRRQQLERAGFAAHPANIIGNDVPGDRGAQIGLAARDGLDGELELRGGGIFQQEARGAGAEPDRRTLPSSARRA